MHTEGKKEERFFYKICLQLQEEGCIVEQDFIGAL